MSKGMAMTAELDQMPIKRVLCSAPMVRACQAGHKTQMRIPLSAQWTVDGYRSRGIHKKLDWEKAEARTQSTLMLALVGKEAPQDPHLCVPALEDETWHRVRPAYDAGDALYVCETWKPHSIYACAKPRQIPPSKIFYRADNAFAPSNTPWIPGQHMPRWASRLTLLVTSVRIEHLQDITTDDAIAEGLSKIKQRYFVEGADHNAAGYAHPDPRMAFKAFWDAEHKKGPDWSYNPWVAVVEFKAFQKNVRDVIRGDAA